jgi:glutaredoxin 3
MQLGRVTVYKKIGCPHCAAALSLLQDEYKLSVSEVDIHAEDAAGKLKQMLMFSSGQKTVPQIFFNSEHLGGNAELQELHKQGTLLGLVQRVKNEAPREMRPGWYHPWY